MTRALIIGNSDGIGLAVTELLLARGWAVAGISRSPSSIHHTHYGHRLADVRERDAYRRALRELRTDVDTCIYCAGIGDILDLGAMETEEAVRVRIGA